MKSKHTRIQREMRTVQVMIKMYCRAHHAFEGDRLCETCNKLQEYALLRLKKCPFQEGKTTCARCPVHCYKPDMRESVRQVMRYAGPRILFRHPWMSIEHVWDGRRKKPLRNPGVNVSEGSGIG